MQYAKMDLAKFAENVKSGRYETRTAARRAAGKADWSNKDRDAAHALINKHWGDEATPSKPKRSKAAKPAKRAAKAAPAKAASAPPPAKKAAKPAKRAPRAAAPAAPSLDLRRTPVTLGAQEPVSTSRMVASANVIQALKNVTPLAPIEKLAYDVAVAEFTVNESDEARAVRMGQRAVPETPAEPKRAPQPKAPPRKQTNGAHEAAPPVPPAVTNARPHIAVPAQAAPPAPAEDIDEATLTPEQKAQLKRVRESVAAMPDLGPVIPPPPLG